MIKGLYSIRDELVGYHDPFTLPDNDDIALREFKKAALSDKPNAVNAHPADIVLFKLATIDDQSGEVTPCKQQLLRASEVT